ncbi:Meiotic recombination protein dmc1 [Phytophthora pseudosyringae]|uniref:Meiotic recombination protein dmc1 n=1 Tax=Phytophthora pseudosyringae TaxID=221518 RepID=A0A8T1VCD1_9STRA|nr:Meiotic recombination protein dmc1 [Phytophthora pseudosyringae]
MGVSRRYMCILAEWGGVDTAPADMIVCSERRPRENGLQMAVPPRISDSDDEEDDSLRSYEPIDLLQDAGINTTDIAKLKHDGFATIGQLFQVSQKRLLGVKGISEAKRDKLLQAGKKIMPEKSGFVSASTLYQQSQNRIFITTGSQQLDQILGGGIETMSVTEVHGEFRTGKTQLCHTLCVTAQLPRSRGGGAGKVAFVDTEGTFRPNRVAEIAKERYNLDPEDVLDNIIVARAHSHDAQMDLVVKLGVLFAVRMDDGSTLKALLIHNICTSQDPDQGPFRLLIIDSVTALFRTDFSGRGELSERQQRLNQHLVRLVKHAEVGYGAFGRSVWHVMADPGANVMFGSAMKPVGGHVMSHGVHTRVLMKKGRAENRLCKIIDSPCMPEAECSIQLYAGGITDSDE